MISLKTILNEQLNLYQGDVIIKNTTNDANGRMNAMKKAKLEPTRLHIVATPVTRVAPIKQYTTINRVLP